MSPVQVRPWRTIARPGRLVTRYATNGHLCVWDGYQQSLQKCVYSLHKAGYLAAFPIDYEWIPPETLLQQAAFGNAPPTLARAIRVGRH